MQDNQIRHLEEKALIKRSIEAVLMVADQPISPRQLAGILDSSLDEIEVCASELTQEYAEAKRGFILQRVAGGFRFQSHPTMAPVVERFVLDGQAARLSSAALETMAIIAYKQPISRNQISSIRGVNSEGVVRTLEARGYVGEVAKDPGPGKASLYGTTPLFLERLGLDSVAELPPLGQFVPGTDVVEALETTLLVSHDDTEASETEAGDTEPGDTAAPDDTAHGDTAPDGTAHGDMASDGTTPVDSEEE